MFFYHKVMFMVFKVKVQPPEGAIDKCFEQEKTISAI